MAKSLPYKITFAIWQTYFGLWSEQIIKAFWPFFSIVLLGLGTALLAPPNLWEFEFIFVWIGLVVVGGFGGLWYAYAWFSAPTFAQAQVRLDQSRFRHFKTYSRRDGEMLDQPRFGTCTCCACVQ